MLRYLIHFRGELRKKTLLRAKRVFKSDWIKHNMQLIYIFLCKKHSGRVSCSQPAMGTLMGAALSALHTEQKEDTGMCSSACPLLGTPECLLLRRSGDLKVPWETVSEKWGKKHCKKTLSWGEFALPLSSLPTPHPTITKNTIKSSWASRCNQQI